MSTSPHSVTEVLERLEEIGNHHDPTVKDLLQAFGETSFVPMLMVPAILLISPLSGIPFFSSICGITIALVAMQMVVRRRHIWLPGFVESRQISGERLNAGIKRLHWFAGWLDRHSKRRMGALVQPPLGFLVQALPVAAGLTVPFLEALPFSSSLIGAATLCFAVSFLARDGLFVLCGLIFLSISASIPILVVTHLI